VAERTESSWRPDHDRLGDVEYIFVSSLAGTSACHTTTSVACTMIQRQTSTCTATLSISNPKTHPLALSQTIAME
jgi:hypothetical protein